MLKHRFLLSAVLPLVFLAADKGGGTGGGKSKPGDPADATDASGATVGQGDPAVTQQSASDASTVPTSTAAPETASQPTVNPSAEAKATYRRETADGKPLEINQRPARLAGLPPEMLSRETAEDRTKAHQDRVRLATEAEKAKS